MNEHKACCVAGRDHILTVPALVSIPMSCYPVLVEAIRWTYYQSKKSCHMTEGYSFWELILNWYRSKGLVLEAEEVTNRIQILMTVKPTFTAFRAGCKQETRQGFILMNHTFIPELQCYDCHSELRCDIPFTILNEITFHKDVAIIMITVTTTKFIKSCTSRSGRYG